MNINDLLRKARRQARHVGSQIAKGSAIVTRVFHFGSKIFVHTDAVLKALLSVGDRRTFGTFVTHTEGRCVTAERIRISIHLVSPAQTDRDEWSGGKYSALQQ